MTICLVVHMYSTFFLKAYRRPRELTWLVGYALFALTLTFGFSGYLLPWNELSFFATAVGTDPVQQDDELSRRAASARAHARPGKLRHVGSNLWYLNPSAATPTRS